MARIPKPTSVHILFFRRLPLWEAGRREAPCERLALEGSGGSWMWRAGKQAGWGGGATVGPGPWSRPGWWTTLGKSSPAEGGGDALAQPPSHSPLSAGDHSGQGVFYRVSVGRSSQGQLTGRLCLVQLVSLFLDTLCGVSRVLSCSSWKGPLGPPS